MAKATNKKQTDARQLAGLRKRAEVLLEKSRQTASESRGRDMQRLIHELQVHQVELEMQNEELRRAQLELENSRDRFAQLYDLAPVGYLTLDVDGVIREANQTVARLLGVDHRALLKKPFSRFIAVESQDEFHLHRQQVFTTPVQQTCELQMRRPDGAAFTGRLESIVEHLTKGASTRCLVALSDVTRHRQVETAMRESQAQLAGIIRSAMDAIITVNSHQRIVLCNEAAEKLFGYTPGQLMGRRLDDLIPTAARKAHAQHIRGFGSTGVTNRRMGALGEVSGRRSDGTEFPIEASISQVDLGEEKLFTVILRDITERLRMDAALRSEKEFSEGLIDTAPVIVLVLDEEARIVRFNPILTEISGHRLEDVRGKDWFTTFLPAADHERVRKVFARAIEGAQTHGNINPILTKDGRLRHIEWFDTLLKRADGSVSGVLAIGSDVTERLRIEEELRRSEGALADFFAEAPVGLLWVGADGRILRVNRAQLEMLGYAGEEVYGQSVVAFHDDTELAAEWLDRLAKGETLNNLHVRFRHQDGSLRHVLIDANGLWVRGRLVHSRWFVRDKTRQVELEREVLKISELEQQRLGQELHDDICQQLTGIEFLAHGLEQKLSGKSRTGERHASQIARLLREANSRVRDLSHGLAPVHLDRDGLGGALERLAQRTRQVFRIDCSVRRPQPIYIDDPQVRLHLYRIAQEAVNNAIKHGRARRIDIRLKTAPGNRLVLGIHDDGAGIPVPLRRKKGMGLRLMQYRAGLICGSLAVQREALGGTSVVCSVRLVNALLKGRKKK